MRKQVGLLLTIPLLLTAAACGGSDDAGSTGESPVDSTIDIAVVTDVATPDAAMTDGDLESDVDVVDDVVTPPSSGGTAVLTLENGETLEFDGVMCTLEPQMAGGSEILFTATSYGDPGIDITQFGDEGAVGGVASIEVYDTDYETLWEAFTIGGSTVELTLDGNTIRGTGDFYDDIEEGLSDPVRGEVVANC